MSVGPVPPVLQGFYEAESKIAEAKALLSEGWNDAENFDRDGAKSAFQALAGILSWLAASFPGSTSGSAAGAAAGTASNDARMCGDGLFGILDLLDNKSGNYDSIANALNGMNLQGFASGIKFS